VNFEFFAGLYVQHHDVDVSPRFKSPKYPTPNPKYPKFIEPEHDSGVRSRNPILVRADRVLTSGTRITLKTRN
jgi:hypothetical protein